MIKDRLWTKDFILVSFINFIITLIFFLLIVTIGVYAVEQFGASTSKAGLVVGIFIIGEVIGRLFIGRFIESIGRRKTLLVGLVLFTLATTLYFINAGLMFLIINRLIHGIAAGITSTAAGTIVVQAIPMSRRGEGIGYFSMSITLATAIGPFIGLLMSQHTSYQMILALCLVLSVIGVISAFFLHIEEVNVPSDEDQAKGFKISNYIELSAMPIAIVTLTISISFASILSFINFYAIEIDLVNTASFFFLVYAIVTLLSRPFTGRLIDIKGANLVMYPGFILFSIGMFVLSAASNSFMLLTSSVLIGLAFGNMQSVAQAIAVKLTPPHRMGLATSTFFIFLDGGLGVGPFFIGLIIPVTGYKVLYVIIGVFLLMASVLYYFLHGRKDHLLTKS